MSPLRVLHLYRPRLPSPRAQSIQVLHTCHALARLGCEVTLLADAPEPGVSRAALPDVDEALAWYGLAPVPGLRLQLSPTAHHGLQGLWFRRGVLAWLAKAGPRSVVLARSKRHARELLRLPGAPPVVLEAHEVDSVLAREAGGSGEPEAALEALVLSRARALVTNCQGTLRLLEQTWPEGLPERRVVVHNATSPDRQAPRAPVTPPLLGYAGSLGGRKDVATLLEAARGLPGGLGLELLGGGGEALGPLPASVTLRGAVPYAEVPDRVARWSAAVVALRDDVFGRWLCNPLKLWDYLALGLPLVLPELPTLLEVVSGEEACWYTPGDAASMRRAMCAAAARGEGPRRLRTWEDRAAELIPVLEAALP